MKRETRRLCWCFCFSCGHRTFCRQKSCMFYSSGLFCPAVKSAAAVRDFFTKSLQSQRVEDSATSLIGEKDSCSHSILLEWLQNVQSSCSFIFEYLSRLFSREQRIESAAKLLFEAENCSLVDKWSSVTTTSSPSFDFASEETFHSSLRRSSGKSVHCWRVFFSVNFCLISSSSSLSTQLLLSWLFFRSESELSFVLLGKFCAQFSLAVFEPAPFILICPPSFTETTSAFLKELLLISRREKKLMWCRLVLQHKEKTSFPLFT